MLHRWPAIQCQDHCQDVC